MADIIQGMFGASPSQIMQDRNATGYAQDLRAVQLDPMQQANLMLRQGGRGFGQSVLAPMLGVEDQELQKAQMAQQLASQFVMTTPEGVMQYAQALAQNGMPEFAQIAVTKAQGMQKTGLDIQQSRLNIDKTQQALTREDKLRTALENVPEGLTQDEKDQYYIDQYRKYGSPDQQARIIEMGINARAKREGESGMGPLTPGQKARDQSFAKEYATFSDLGGKSVIDKNLLALKDAIALLEADPNLTGTTSQILDATGTLSAVNPNAQTVKDLAGGVIQGNLRQVLGGQFASKEGEQLLNRAFNIAQPGADNLKRLKSLQTQIEEAAAIKVAAGEYFEEFGTLKGFKPPKTITSKEGKPMPDATKLKAYATKHFNGNVAEATAYLSTQGYK